jgi:hypothetical protein
MDMLIDHVFPETATQRARLPARLIAEAEARNLAAATIDAVLSVLPSALSSAGAFFDEMTGLWRYEFGVPYQLGTGLIWGTHMWLPIRELLDCLLNLNRCVPLEKRASYLRILADPEKHPQTLVEMAPVTRIGSEMALDFEVSGHGNGNRTVDWLIRSTDGRTVLCDVKRRTKDFLIQFERIGDSPEAPEPDHDPALLFKSLEHKFVANEPDAILQGAWIFTDIMQNGPRLQAAFEFLDASKVHFAVVGDWASDAHVISRRSEDAQFLRELFGIVESSRFVFSPGTSQNP